MLARGSEIQPSAARKVTEGDKIRESNVAFEGLRRLASPNLHKLLTSSQTPNKTTGRAAGVVIPEVRRTSTHH